MTDITKCNGKLNEIPCPLKQDCWRYNAPCSQRQSFFMNAPYDEQKKECPEFLDYKKG